MARDLLEIHGLPAYRVPGGHAKELTAHYGGAAGLPALHAAALANRSALVFNVVPRTTYTVHSHTVNLPSVHC